MYLPPPFAVEDRAQVCDLLRSVGAGHLVSVAGGATPSLEATLLPFVVDDELRSIRAHFSRANQHWRSADGSVGLFIVPASGAYVSPRWYPSKAEHGRVVPTWNYELVHLRGRIEIHDDPEWLHALVSDLTDINEHRTSMSDGLDPWAVDDAPPRFVDKQIRAIVGVELHVDDVQAKRKLSQNKDERDRLGALAGLASSSRRSDTEVAAAMRLGERPAPH